MRYRFRLNLPGTPDLAFPRARLALFVDGCFWHGFPEHYRDPASNVTSWKEELKRNFLRNQQVDRELGWKVIRVWEHEVIHDVGIVVGRVIGELEKPLSDGD